MDAMTLSFRTEVSISSGENILAMVEALSRNSEILYLIDGHLSGARCWKTDLTILFLPDNIPLISKEDEKDSLPINMLGGGDITLKI